MKISSKKQPQEHTKTIHDVRQRLRQLVDHRRFSMVISILIAVNAVTLGLETWPDVMNAVGSTLQLIDVTILSIFVIEISLRLAAYGRDFFRSGWNIFDLSIVTVALIPAMGPFSVLRALRILRVLRLLSVVPQLRTVVNALFSAVPGMSAILAVLILVFYVAAVIATKLFGSAFSDWFGHIGASMYSLFQIMTLESWSMGIVRPVMEVYPWAWVFFVPFIITTSFAVLNLFIALLVNSLHLISAQESAADNASEHPATSSETVIAELKLLRKEITQLHHQMEKIQNRQDSHSDSENLSNEIDSSR